MGILDNEIGSIAGLPADSVRRYNNQLVRLMGLYLELYPRAITAKMAAELAKECRISDFLLPRRKILARPFTRIFAGFRLAKMSNHSILSTTGKKSK